MTNEHLSYLTDQIAEFNKKVEERNKQIDLLKIQNETDKNLIKVLEKGYEKLKEKE